MCEYGELEPYLAGLCVLAQPRSMGRSSCAVKVVDEEAVTGLGSDNGRWDEKQTTHEMETRSKTKYEADR